MKQKFPLYVAEFVGTFILVTFGCGAIIVNYLSGGQITHLGVSLVFGLVVTALICAIGPISGAHLNPAVTLAFLTSGRFKKSDLLPYLISQVLGAIFAAIFLKIVFGTSAGLGMTSPSGAPQQSFLMEIFMTYVLGVVIMGVATHDHNQGVLAGIAIGATVCIAALFGGPISGASLNPARSIGPALVMGDFSQLWIYCVAPVLGILSGAHSYIYIRCQGAATTANGCC